jgi:hypothetical protein
MTSRAWAIDKDKHHVDGLKVAFSTFTSQTILILRLTKQNGEWGGLLIPVMQVNTVDVA